MTILKNENSKNIYGMNKTRNRLRNNNNNITNKTGNRLRNNNKYAINNITDKTGNT